MDRLQYKEEINWQDLRKKPEKLFGYSYIYFLAVFTILGLMYIFNLTTIGKNSVRPAIQTDSSVFIHDIPIQSPRILPPVDIMKVALPTPNLIARGRELFMANCVSCHGDNGLGDGPTASTLNPKPRDFQSLKDWKNGSKITQIYKTLQEGIPGSAMASYDYMPPSDRFALIHYVRTFASSQPTDSAGDLKRLDATYDLSKGVNVPGQIPIRKAMRLVEQESVPAATAIIEQKKELDTSNNIGAEIMKRVTYDETKVAISFMQVRESIKNLDEFIKFISADPLHAGFKPGVVRLSGIEWEELYQYWIKLGKQEG